MIASVSITVFTVLFVLTFERLDNPIIKKIFNSYYKLINKLFREQETIFIRVKIILLIPFHRQNEIINQ